MPNAAKATAAILFAGLAYYVSLKIIPIYSADRVLPYFSLMNAAMGLAIGWRVCGRLAGRGYGAALGNAVTTAVVLMGVALFAHSVEEMISRAFRQQYSGPVDAVVAVADIMATYASQIAIADVLIPAAIGSILAALIVELVAQVT
ncbi:MAG: TrgA family protein [Pseudomonadota bacterium]